MTDIIQSFVDEMQKHGCGPESPSDIVASGEDLYFKIAGDKKGKRGGYCLTIMPDGFAYGNFVNFKTGEKGKWNSSQGNKKLTKEEKEAFSARIKQIEKDREARQAKIHEEKSKEAEMEWGVAEECKSHPYLTKKKVAAFGLRTAGDLLIIPMSSEGKIWSYQTISPDGEKLFLPGGKKKGCYYKIGGEGNVIGICEGVATGATLHEALEIPIYVAFDAGNLELVAEEIRRLHQNADIYIFADSDQWSTDQKGKLYNVGLVKGQQAAKKINGFCLAPEFPADDMDLRTDWNDYGTANGLDAIKTAVSKIIENNKNAQEDIYTQEFDEAPTIDDDGNINLTRSMGMPFKILGHNNGIYYYFPFGLQQIFGWTAAGHTMNNLLQLASLKEWQDWAASVCPVRLSNKEIPLYAFDSMKQIATDKGVFQEEDRVRGCGAWMDAGRVVLHCGDRLLVDGIETLPKDIKGHYVYTAATQRFKCNVEPLSNKEAQRLREICVMPTWENPLSGLLLAGWLVTAPVCAALEWRPHIWLTGEAGAGKAQPHTSLVLTPEGWRKMGDLKIGDYVTTPDNGYAKILNIFPQGKQETFKITFADGRSARATKDHLWKVRVKGAWRIRTTEQLIELSKKETRLGISLAVPLAEPLDIERNRKQNLLLHPYVLGVLLGDGNFGNDECGSTTTGITSFDDQIIERARNFLPDFMGIFESKTVKGRFRLGDLSKYGRRTRGLIKDLRLLGKKSHDKFIPKDYLCASIENRWELLKGLMDTDGHAGKNGSMSYCTVSKQLCEDVVYLVRSLGGIASVYEKHTSFTYKEEERDGQLAYNINIRFKNRSHVFSLPRKLERVNKAQQYDECTFLNVEKIERDSSEECSCILIDHPDRLYVTDGFVVTHNTTLMTNIIKKVLSKISYNVDGGTSESSIREGLGYDARPVIYDEAEGHGAKTSLMDGVLGLAKLSSSSGYVGKRGQTRFIARSSFCFSAIYPPIKDFASETRISLLALKKNTSKNSRQHFEDLMAAINETLTPDYGRRMLARTVKYMPNLLTNIQTFKKAATSVIKDARAADQISAMLGGLYMLGSTGLVSEKEAEKWISERDWTEHTAISEVSDQERLLHYISTAVVSVKGSNGTRDYTIGALIASAIGRSDDCPEKMAKDALRHYSILARPDGIFIGNSNQNLKKILKDTEWVLNWNKTLSRIPGAKQISYQYFGSGNDKQRALRIPAEIFYGEKLEVPAAVDEEVELIPFD